MCVFVWGGGGVTVDDTIICTQDSWRQISGLWSATVTAPSLHTGSP